MGNEFCSITKNKTNEKDWNQYNLSVSIVSKPNSATPYENFKFDKITNYDSPDSNAIFPEEYLITPTYQSEYQSPSDSFYSKASKLSPVRPSLSGIDRDSVFTTEPGNISVESQINEYSNQLYEIIFKRFLQENFPFSQEVIKEMIRRKLLSEHDTSSILSLSNVDNIAEIFLRQFKFSEVNLCKLATFLFVSVNENYPVFYNSEKSNKFLYAIVDQIYYVVNIVSLIQNYTDQVDILQSLISHSSLISIVYGKKDASVPKPEDRLQNSQDIFIRIYLNELILPPPFWYNFSLINEDFHCCQELIISSCNLLSEDVYNLIQGFRSSNTLRILDLSANPIGDLGLKHIQSLFQIKNNIEILNLKCCSLTYKGVEEFLEVLHQNSLRFHLHSLFLGHNELNNMSENSVLILTKLSFTMLELQSTNMRYQKSLFESLKLNYSLRHLDISRNQLLNKDLTYLASGLAYNNQLKSVSLAMMGLSTNDCGTINNALLMNKSLVSIDLSDNIVGDEGIEILKDLLIMKKSLKEIIMKRCNISLNGIFILLQQIIAPDSQLELLDLCYNRCENMTRTDESKELLNKIYDILHKIKLVKNIRILLWGTIDLYKVYIDN